MAALHVLRHIELHVVAEIVEAELVVRAVGDVAAVGRVPLRVAQVVLNHADRHSEEAVDAAHPVGIAAGEIVVDGDDVHALLRRGRSGRRRDVATSVFPSPVFISAILPRCSTIPPTSCTSKCRHGEHAPPRLAHHREGIDQQIVELGTLIAPLAKLRRLRAEIFVRERADIVLALPDGRDKRLNAFEVALVLGAEDLGQ